MSVLSAWQDPVYLAYLKAIVGVLLFAGGILALLTYVMKKNVSSIWATYRGWLVMGPLFLGSVLLGQRAVVVLFTTLSVFGIKEFARATGLYRDWGMTGAAYLGSMALGILCMVKDPFKGNIGWYGMFMALPVYIIAVILLIPILKNRVKGQLQAAALAILGFIYMGWMFGHLALLTTSLKALGYLLFLVFAVEINDVAAFTFGKLFGKHPLRSEISPKKTWEGSMGALAVSMTLPWLLQFSLPGFGTLPLLLTGLIVGVGGQLGDLSISVIKRDIGVKDMGVSIPGHGGVLDRIDSLIYTAPLFVHMLRFFQLF